MSVQAATVGSMTAILTSEFFQDVLARLRPDDVVLYTWVMGRHPESMQSSCCTGPFLDETGRPSTVVNDNSFRLAASLAFSYPDMIDPQRFDFGIVHGVPRSNLLLFNEQISDWIRRWMTGPANDCEYPQHFLDLVLAVSFEANRAEPPPPHLPLRKSLPS